MVEGRLDRECREVARKTRKNPLRFVLFRGSRVPDPFRHKVLSETCYLSTERRHKSGSAQWSTTS